MNYKSSYGPEGKQEWTAATYVLSPTSSRITVLAKKLSNFPFKIFFFGMYRKSPAYSYKLLKEDTTLLRDFSQQLLRDSQLGHLNKRRQVLLVAEPKNRMQ